MSSFQLKEKIHYPWKLYLYRQQAGQSSIIAKRKSEEKNAFLLFSPTLVTFSLKLNIFEWEVKQYINTINQIFLNQRVWDNNTFYKIDKIPVICLITAITIWANLIHFLELQKLKPHGIHTVKNSFVQSVLKYGFVFSLPIFERKKS